MNFFLLTLGCPKNQVDSEMMAQRLVEAGHRAVAEPQAADVLIANTCAFIRDARDESLEALATLAQEKRPDQALVAAGCLAQRDCDSICRRIPQVDAVIGTRSWAEIVSVLESLGQRRRGVHRIISDQGNLVATGRRTALMGHNAYLKIGDGCDAGCAFCAIPLIKGPQQSKPMNDILQEARDLVSQGVQELILIAQDTTAYGRDLGMADGLATLVGRLSEIVPQEGWIRILYAYPQHISDALIATMAEVPQVCHYLDLPLQHGHPEVLRRMRRPHDVASIHDRIGALRRAMPDISLRSTFIVGFPGETEEEFRALLSLIDEIAFDHVGVFTYSQERGTLAAEMPHQVSPAVARERHEQVMLAQQAISYRRNSEQVGRVLRVLVDENIDGRAVARSYRDAPEIDGTVLVATPEPLEGFVPVRIVAAQPYDLEAELLS